MIEPWWPNLYVVGLQPASFSSKIVLGYLVRQHRAARISSTGVLGSGSGTELGVRDLDSGDGRVAHLTLGLRDDLDAGLVAKII